MYLYKHIDEIDKANFVVMHSNLNFLPSRQVPTTYVRTLMVDDLSGTYRQVLLQLTKEVHDYRSFNRLTQLADVLFSNYESIDGTLHIYPDMLLTKGAYETMRERLDEIAINS